MGKTLRELRKDSKLKTNKITYELGIQSSTLYSWENAVRLIPLNQLDRLLKLYGVSINEFDFETLLKQFEDRKKQVN